MSFDLTIQLLSPEEISAEEAYELCEVVDSDSTSSVDFGAAFECMAYSDRSAIVSDEEYMGFSLSYVDSIEDTDFQKPLVRNFVYLAPEYRETGLENVLDNLSTIYDFDDTDGYLVATWYAGTKHNCDLGSNISPEIFLENSNQEENSLNPYTESRFLSNIEESTLDERLNQLIKEVENVCQDIREPIKGQVFKIYNEESWSNHLDEFYDIFVGQLDGEPMSPASKGLVRREVRKQLSRVSKRVSDYDSEILGGVELENKVLSVGPGDSEIPEIVASEFQNLDILCLEPSNTMAGLQRDKLRDLDNANVRNESLYEYIFSEAGEEKLAAVFAINSIQETVAPQSAIRYLNDMVQIGGEVLYTYPGPGTKRPLIDDNEVERLSVDVSEHPDVGGIGLHPWGKYVDQEILQDDSPFKGMNIVKKANIRTEGGEKLKELLASNGITEFKTPDQSEGGVRLTVASRPLGNW